MTHWKLPVSTTVMWATLALTALLVLGAKPAASSPGENGRIAYVSKEYSDESQSYSYDIWAMNPDGTGHVNLTRDQPCCNYGPAWSPDGTKVAFTSDRDGQTEIYVMGADGSGPTRLTVDAAPDSSPTWSPDGTRLAFLSGRDGQTEIYVMGADGSGPTRLTEDPAHVGAPVWSPDGTRMAFTDTVAASDSGCPSQEIFTMEADGSGVPEQITHHGDSDCLGYFTDTPDWSPDGMEIAFSRGAPYLGSAIYAVRADGSGERRVAVIPAGSRPSSAPAGLPSWSPGGTKVALQGIRSSDSREIFAVTSDGPDGPQSLTGTGDCHGEGCPDFEPLDPDWGTAPPAPVLPPDTAITSGPSGTVHSNTVRFGFSSDQRAVGYECSLDGAAFARCGTTREYTRLSEGPHKIKVRAVDAAGNTDESPATRAWTVDTEAPKVAAVSPADRKKDVRRGANLKAIFSEKMEPSAITKSTFRVYRCAPGTFADCTDRINHVTVSLSANRLRATLDPHGTSEIRLRPGARHKAVVTTGAKDSAGTALDQNATVRGDQRKVWRFTTESR